MGSRGPNRAGVLEQKKQMLALNKARLEIIDKLDVTLLWVMPCFSIDDRERFRAERNSKGEIAAAHVLLNELEKRQPTKTNFWWNTILENLERHVGYAEKLRKKLQEIEAKHRKNGDKVFRTMEIYDDGPSRAGKGKSLVSDMRSFTAAGDFAKTVHFAYIFPQSTEKPQITLKFKLQKKPKQKQPHPDGFQLGQHTVNKVVSEDVAAALRTMTLIKTIFDGSTDKGGEGESSSNVGFGPVSFVFEVSYSDTLEQLFHAVTDKAALPSALVRALNERTEEVDGVWRYTYDSASLANVTPIRGGTQTLRREDTRLLEHEQNLRLIVPALQEYWHLTDKLVEDLFEWTIITDEERKQLKSVSEKNKKDRVLLLVVFLETKNQPTVAKFEDYIFKNQTKFPGLQKAMRQHPSLEAINAEILAMDETMTAYRTQQKDKQRVGREKLTQAQEKQERKKTEKNKVRPRGMLHSEIPEQIEETKNQNRDDLQEAKKALESQQKKRNELYKAALKRAGEPSVLAIKVHMDDADDSISEAALQLLKEHKDDLLPLQGAKVIDVRKPAQTIVCDAEFDTLIGAYNVSDDVTCGTFTERCQGLCKEGDVKVTLDVVIDQGEFALTRQNFMGTERENQSELRKVFENDDAEEQEWDSRTVVADRSWLTAVRDFFQGRRDAQTPAEIPFSCRDKAVVKYEELYSYTTEQSERLRSCFGLEASYIYLYTNNRNTLQELKKSDDGSFVLTKRFQAVQFRIMDGDKIAKKDNVWVNLDKPLREVVSLAVGFEPQSVSDSKTDAVQSLDFNLRRWAEETEISSLNVVEPGKKQMVRLGSSVSERDRRQSVGLGSRPGTAASASGISIHGLEEIQV